MLKADSASNIKYIVQYTFHFFCLATNKTFSPRAMVWTAFIRKQKQLFLFCNVSHLIVF